jgi:beta-lactamase regulating signal transducer with metallopeptidase domain
MSFIILVVLIGIALIPNKFSPSLRYPAWVIILLGLVIPMRPIIGAGLLIIELPFVEQMQSGNFEGTTMHLTVNEVQNTYTQISPITVIAIVWISVAIIIFAYHIWRYIRFAQIIRRWGVAVNDKAALSIFRAVREEKGIKRDIGLKKCGFVSTSMLVGFFRPVVLLPDKDYDSDELELIFRHELIHYKRGDLYIKLLSVIAASLHWFNPAVYLMSQAMQADCEASCDEKVLAEVGVENNQFYAELILDMIGGRGVRSTQLSTCFYGGKRGVKIRMDAIMSGAGSATKISFSALLVLLSTMTILSGSVFAFSGYSSQEPHIQHYEIEALDLQISVMQAREIALEEVGGGILSGLFYDHMLNVFRIEILHGGNRYYLGIDANDGSVMVYRREEIEMQNITWAQAMEIALGTMENGQIIFGGMEIIDGFQIFLFNIESNGREYEIIIGPAGEVLINEYSG